MLIAVIIVQFIGVCCEMKIQDQSSGTGKGASTENIKLNENEPM
jgi:hypothetical protein